jgi:ATP-dependent Clp protease ATP-binding subunit ClpB
LPKVTGQGGEILPSRELQNTLNLMDKAAKARRCLYCQRIVFAGAGTGKRHHRQNSEKAGASEASLNNAIDAMRGGQTVDNPNAEDQREALKKYTLDLTQRARDGKLDPVIGRDDEIRRAIQVLATAHQKQSRANRRARRG